MPQSGGNPLGIKRQWTFLNKNDMNFCSNLGQMVLRECSRCITPHPSPDAGMVAKTYPPYVRFNNTNYLPESKVDEILSALAAAEKKIEELRGDIGAHLKDKEEMRDYIFELEQKINRD